MSDNKFNFAFETDAAIENYDPTAENTMDFHPPIPGNYKLTLEFAKPEEPIGSGTKAEPKKAVIWSSLNGTIIGYEDNDRHFQDESAYMGRKTFNNYVSTATFKNSTSMLTDLLKAMGYSMEELAKLSGPGGLVHAAKLLRHGINLAAPVSAYLNWSWTGKTETLKTESGDPIYIRYDKKAHPNVPRGVKKTAEGKLIYELPYEFRDASGQAEVVMLKPQLSITSYNKPEEGSEPFVYFQD